MMSSNTIKNYKELYKKKYISSFSIYKNEWKRFINYISREIYFKHHPENEHYYKYFNLLKNTRNFKRLHQHTTTTLKKLKEVLQDRH